MKFLALGMVLVTGCIALILGLGWHLTTPPSDTASATPFEIESGESVTSIAHRLQAAGLIRSELAFKAYVSITSIAPKLQAGTFTLSTDADLATQAKALTRAKAESIRVTLLPGWRREEMAEALKKAFTGVGSSFDPEVFLDQPGTEEGYLFPDTYEFKLGASEAEVAGVIAKNFATKRASIESTLSSSDYPFEDILIMASIIERETRVDRALVAGILWKRLDNGWPLEVDASLQYIKGYDRASGTWWPTPYSADKELESGYNTYKYDGLPPGPIANPALSAIEAAAKPEFSDYWFYLTDRSGQMRYAADYQEHLININRYLR